MLKTYIKLNIIPLLALILLITCASPGKKNQNKVKKDMINFKKGTYGFDKSFFKENSIEIVELKDKASRAGILIAPGYQGRVMTSTAEGDEGLSFGWINYKFAPL